MTIKIVADDKIPFLRGVLEPFADVVYLPGKAIDNHHLKNADALLTRTRTCCDERLLKDTSIQFIGTATIGYDHIDTQWCEKQGIVWKNAPGCNASSVNQYIASTLVNLSEKFNFSWTNKVLGVVGVGNVGSKVVYTAEMMGLRVYLCDPPRVKSEGTCGFISLEGIVRDCDIITFHVPLNQHGPYKTYQMIDYDFLAAVNPGTIIINTSRGEVADGKALKQAFSEGKIASPVLDVWENEPDIDRELLSLCCQATPHIAGYSADGKAMGTSMIVQALSRHFNLGIDGWETNDIPAPVNAEIRINCQSISNQEILKRAIKHTYDVQLDDQRLRGNPADFERQRGEYPPRREFKAYTLHLENGDHDIKRICRRMGFKVL
jgi:erythronate-4-phosphate dehydrogenase